MRWALTLPHDSQAPAAELLVPRISSQQLPWDNEEKGLAGHSLAHIAVLPSQRWELGQVSGLLGTPAEDSVRGKNGQDWGGKASTRHPTAIPKVTVNSKRSPEPIPWEPPKSPPHRGVGGCQPLPRQAPGDSWEPAESTESVVSPRGLQNELPWGRGLRPGCFQLGFLCSFKKGKNSQAWSAQAPSLALLVCK